jgi:hypothetical protein
MSREHVYALLAEMPMSDDGTGHVVDCGYTEDHRDCGCMTLPDRLDRVLNLVRAEARSAAIAELIGNVQTVYDMQVPLTGGDYLPGARVAHRWWATVLGGTLRDLRRSADL